MKRQPGLEVAEKLINFTKKFNYQDKQTEIISCSN